MSHENASPGGGSVGDLDARRLTVGQILPTQAEAVSSSELGVSSMLRLLMAFDVGLVPPFSFIERITVAAMTRAGIHPALIHAYRETGLILREGGRCRATPGDLAAWRAAVEQWEQTHSARAPRMWVDDADFWRMAGPHPQERQRAQSDCIPPGGR